MPAKWSISAPLSLDQLQAIEETALRILEAVGLEVENAWLRSTLAARGYATDAAGRIRVSRTEAKAFLKTARERHGHSFTPEPQSPPAESAPPCITLDASSYALHVHDIDTDAITPLTVAAQVRALHLVHALRHEGLVSTWVGQPCDVPSPRRHQPLACPRFASRTRCGPGPAQRTPHRPGLRRARTAVSRRRPHPGPRPGRARHPLPATRHGPLKAGTRRHGNRRQHHGPIHPYISRRIATTGKASHHAHSSSRFRDRTGRRRVLGR